MRPASARRLSEWSRNGRPPSGIIAFAPDAAAAAWSGVSDASASFFMREPSPRAITTALFVAMVQPSRPRWSAMVAATASASSRCSISAKTRSTGSVPEKRIVAQPPLVK